MSDNNWNFDYAHSEIGFTIKHMMFAKVRGTFGEWSGEIALDDSGSLRGGVTAEIDIASIDTGNGDRDAHLRSADFFDVEHHPTMTFVARSFSPHGDGVYEVIGDLTIRGTTREITLDVQRTGHGIDPWGNTRVGFSAAASLKRSDFGLTWNQALETGGVLVGDEVKIAVEVQALSSSAILKKSA
jgi:polyisoprenoid-binding protein YceI